MKESKKTEENFESWMKKMEKMKTGSVDLSTDEDLSFALMNLVSLEEHFYFTAMKTGNKKYLDLMHSIREMRKKYLSKIVKSPVGEEWCISKHLLAGSMRLYEVGTKEFSKGNKKQAEECFRSAFDLWSLFFAINLKMIGAESIEKELIEAGIDGVHNKEMFSEGEKKMSKFSSIMKKIVDCCKEW